MTTTAIAPVPISETETNPRTLASARVTEPPRLSRHGSTPLTELWLGSRNLLALARRMESQAAIAISRSSNSG